MPKRTKGSIFTARNPNLPRNAGHRDHTILTRRIHTDPKHVGVKHTDAMPLALCNVSDGNHIREFNARKAHG